MSVAQNVQKSVNAMPAGQIFGYQALPSYVQSPSAVIKAVGRLVTEKRLARFSKGKFYIPSEGLMGLRKPSDTELIRSVLYKEGRLRGYVTGLAIYNQLGLTTQVPRTITVAINGGRQEKDFGTIRIKTVIARMLIEEPDVKLLQYLDVLKNLKNIPDANINQSLEIMRRYISDLKKREQVQLVLLAEKYYTPQTRALVGLLFSSLELSVPQSLALSLNPTTTYQLKLDQDQWPMAKQWSIR